MPTPRKPEDPGPVEETAEQEAEFRRRINAELDARAAVTASSTMEGEMKTYQGREMKPTGAVTAAGVPVYELAELPSIVPEDAVPIGGNEPDSREWTAVLALEGVATSDGRMLGIDSVAWRELPLPLMAMLTSDHGGVGGSIAIVGGRIDAIEKVPVAAAISAGVLSEPEGGFPPDAVAVVGRGVFDDSWNGDEVLRLVADKTLRGVSIDLSPERVEILEMPPDEESPNNVIGGYLEIVTSGKIMGATVCPFAAFEGATIRVDTLADETNEPAEEAAPVLAAMRARTGLRVSVLAPLLAAGLPRAWASVDHSQSSMIATSPTPEQCMSLAAPGGQPAGDMHVTLAYLPDTSGIDFAALHKIVAKVADAHDAVEGQVGGAGYFGPADDRKPDAKPAEKNADDEAGQTAAAEPPPVADPETPITSEADPDAEAGDEAEPGPLHPHVALVDAPGLSKMRGALCDALDEAGVPYAQNHDFTPHITLGYEATPTVPAMEHAHKPLSFGAITVHEGPNRTDHPLRTADAVTASAAGLAPDAPPAAWFADPELGEPTPLTITDEGRIYGHLATWGTCHVGVRDACVEPPSSESDYALFHLGHVLSEEGELVPVGTFTMDTGHADLAMNLRSTQKHYDDTGTAVADVRVGEDDTGIWFAGAIRPELSAMKVRALRAAQISGDWRPHEGGREFCAGLAVNVPGFPVVRPRGAIAAGGALLGLVAAGVDLAPPPVGARGRVLALAERARPGYLDERRAELAARAGVS